jgi:hypothetical protein
MVRRKERECSPICPQIGYLHLSFNQTFAAHKQAIQTLRVLCSHSQTCCCAHVRPEDRSGYSFNSLNFTDFRTRARPVMSWMRKVIDGLPDQLISSIPK